MNKGFRSGLFGILRVLGYEVRREFVESDDCGWRSGFGRLRRL